MLPARTVRYGNLPLPRSQTGGLRVGELVCTRLGHEFCSMTVPNLETSEPGGMWNARQASPAGPGTLHPTHCLGIRYGYIGFSFKSLQCFFQELFGFTGPALLHQGAEEFFSVRRPPRIWGFALMKECSHSLKDSFVFVKDLLLALSGSGRVKRRRRLWRGGKLSCSGSGERPETYKHCRSSNDAGES